VHFVGEVAGHEEQPGTQARIKSRGRQYGAAARTYPHPFALIDVKSSHILRREIDASAKSERRVEAAGLHTGVVIRKPRPCRQAQRKFVVELVHRQAVFGGAELRQLPALLGILLPESRVQEW